MRGVFVWATRLLIGAWALIGPSAPLSAGQINLLVPAYGNPCCGGGPVMWQSLIDTALSGPSNISLSVIFNPASGPGVSVDPNYVDINGDGPLPDLKDAGATIYGYVSTDFGDRLPSDVKADIDRYFDSLYPNLIDGVFFDEMSNDLADVGYYQDLRNYVKAKKADALVIGNPGTTFTNNPSNQTTHSVDDYVQAADILVTFENISNEYENNYTPPTWINDYDADRFAHVVFSHSTWDPNLLTLAKSRKASLLYVTDDNLPNPYDTLVSYWQALLDDLSNFNPVMLACAGFMPPFDSDLVLKKKSKKSIPLKIELFNDEEVFVADLASPPVVSVTFSTTATGEALPADINLLPNGAADDDNIFELSDDKWINILGTKIFSAPGNYTISVVSGDEWEYKLDPACFGTFERQ